MGYVIQTTDGQVRLFASEAQALAWEKKQPENVGIISGCEVNAAAHYCGKIPASGVRFTREDQSTPQLVAALMNQ